MFENRVLRRIFGPKKGKEELYVLYTPPIIKTIKSRRISLAGHVTHVGEIRNE
jgi:hypothetical protein